MISKLNGNSVLHFTSIRNMQLLAAAYNLTHAACYQQLRSTCRNYCWIHPATAGALALVRERFAFARNAAPLRNVCRAAAASAARV